uniref:Uncharacterized protein n=1 Tax=viral metagenome TaxID=1070528 RepID=A0A6C0KD58_9ZZZZ
MSAVCKAYTCKGTKCTKAAAEEYCTVHINSMKMVGPMRFHQNQERYIARRDIVDAGNNYCNDRSPESWTSMLVANAILEGTHNRHAVERRMGPHTLADQKSYERLASKLRRRKELREGLRERENFMYHLRGDGRDEELNVRFERAHYIRMAETGEMTARGALNAFMAWRRAEAARRDVWEDEHGEREYEQFGPPIPRAVDGDHWLAEPPRERTLAEIAADNQNIHTTEVVKKFKDMVELIRKIDVPEDYRWNMTKVSKTMPEVIADCELTPKAAWQFSSKYCAADTIYDMEEGIFGKLMDSVWQHVKASPESADLKKIVKEELEMNIGMCAQGNITRVANILVGILDGLNPPEESRIEKIARAIADLRPTLVGKTQVEIRLAAMKVLVPLRMTAEEMKPWVEAIAELVE